MKPQSTESFSAFASLNRYFVLAETTKPTADQAAQATELLPKIYGAKDEKELFEKGDSELIEIYKEIKTQISSKAQ